MFFIKRNKYLLIAIAIALLATVLIEFSSGYIINSQVSNWKQTSKLILEQIEQNTSQRIIEKQEKLFHHLHFFSERLIEHLREQNGNYYPAFELTSQEIFYPYQIYVFDKDSSLVVWSESANQSVTMEVMRVFKEDEYFFIRSNLKVLLAAYKKLNSYTIFITQPVEKEYRLNSSYFAEVSLSDELSEEYKTEVTIDFVSTKEFPKDGRLYTFPLYNNFNNTIAYVTVHTPQLSTYKNDIRNELISWQSYLLLGTIFLLGILVRKNRELFRNRTVKFAIFVIYLSLLRLVLYWFSVPSKIFSGNLNNPAFFESTFAFGIFRSPIEFFISAILILAVIIQGGKYFLQFLNETRQPRLNNKLIYLILIFNCVFFILTVRGFGASMRSIVFESSLRYFKYPFVLPDPPTLLMDINILILGICAMCFLIYILVASFRLFQKVNNSHWPPIVIGFVIIQFLALIFDLVQLQPQGTSLLRISFITAVFIFSIYLYKFLSASTSYIISLLFAASILTISYLIYFNSDFEIKSLRTTAFDLLKPNQEQIAGVVQTVASDETIIRKLETELTEAKDLNFDAIAFRIWSNSQLQGEKVSSLVNIIGSNKQLLGSFNYNFEEDFIWDWSPVSDSLIQLTSLNSALDNTGNRILRSINPLFNKGKLVGYVEVSALLDFYTLDFSDEYDIIGSSKVIEESPINTKQLKIFDFQDGELTNYYTDLILSESEKEKILSAELNDVNEAWLNMPLNELDHVIYLKKVRDPNKKRYIAVALSENELSWSLFNFFKIFLVHCLFILLGLLLFYLPQIGKITQLKFTFRTQLLFAFIVISTLPLVLLALYFKNLTEEKNTAAIYYKLGKRADRIEKYINDYLPVDTTFTEDLLQRASNDTGIEFDLYSGKNLVHSSKQVYYDVGLIPKIINSKIYKYLLLTGRTDYVVTEKIENREFHSFYHKAEIGGEEYLIGVNDLFNSIQLPMSAAEVDIFLLGSYSLAVILVIVFSTILANQISSPIRRLTFATSAVAGGDLSISIHENNKGEVGELVDGFNKMVFELQKNQKELAEMEREAAWKEMAKQVAHEIKNPLTPMKLAVQQLIVAKDDNSKKYEQIFSKVTDTVIKQIDILKNIATEFSNFAKMPDLRISEVNLVELINNSLALFSEEKIKIELRTPKAYVKISTDADQLQRTLVNLIRNSIQAGAENLVFEIEEIGTQLVLRVSDDGKGISEEIKSKIFDANFTTKVEGMGLGLNMAKRFFESTNASIDIESTNGRGTIIIIKFNT